MHRLGYFRKLYKLFGLYGSIEFICKWIFSRTEFCIKPLQFPYPLWLRKSEPDIHNFWQIFGEKECDIPELINPSAIIDIGSFVGYSAAYFLWKYPQAHLTCVEPNPSNISNFKKNIQNFSNYTLIEAAISESDNTYTEFSFVPGQTWAGSTKPVPGENKKSINVCTIKFEELVTSYGYNGFDLMKIDIEGNESLILTKEDLCAKYIGYILVEIHDKDSFAALEQLQLGNKFKILRVSGEKYLLQNLHFKRTD